MKPWAKALGGLGLVAAAAGGLLYSFSLQGSQYGLYGLGLGLALVAAAAIGSADYLKAFFSRRSARLGLSAGAGVLVALALVVVLGSLASRHHVRWDFSQDKRHTLADQSVKVVGGFTSPVKAYAFFRETQQGRLEAEDLLQRFALANRNFTFQFVDPDRDPGLAKRYDIRTYGTVLLTMGDREERVKLAEEQGITNALIKLSHPGKKVVFLVTGHGERGVADIGQEGISELKKALEQQNYEVKPLLLAAGQHVPAEASLVVLAGPKKPLAENELAGLTEYMAKGGGLLMLIDPESDAGLEGWLKARGVILGHNVIVDPQSRLFGASPAWPIAADYNDHEITRPLEGTFCYFPFARSLELAEPKPQGISGQVLVRSSQTSWGETDLKALQEGQARVDEGQDVRGPLNLALLISQESPQAKPGPDGKPADPGKPLPKGRLVVVGDSDFVANAHLNQAANRDLALNAASYLADEQDLLSIRPKDTASQPLLLSPAQAQAVFWVPVVLLPLFFLVLGIVVVRRRRRPAA